MGSVPIARMASTCSVTCMDPNSDAIPDALRPATNKPVIVGPSSRTKASETTSPVSDVSPKRTNCAAVCKTITAPMKNPVSSTIGREPTPMMSICSSRSAA